ncbi:hypothetical protein [Micromonospora sp. NBC_01796]|uniref:hypothetical protein n=1 Tax=Micromonospora sp. NBC_01796 TaxID=2975987 RepID=UPI002DDA055B|nr:hypothetical protein [Micromonospora sp. NBC_01796]WSA85160.1 hypothetical protein OIE47_33180 [Micromonospora sp. NBC_01796]
MNEIRTRAEPRLGIDIGRVIIDGTAHPGGGDTAFFSGDEATMLATPEMPDAIEVIARLVIRFHGRVWLVSKCGPRVQDRTLRWLAGHDFYRRTGLAPDRVRFCRRRTDKRVHCLELALTHFVDDHPEVHAAIHGAVVHQYFFGPQRRPVPGYGQPTPTWADVERLVDRSLQPGQPPAPRRELV